MAYHPVFRMALPDCLRAQLVFLSKIYCRQQRRRNHQDCRRKPAKTVTDAFPSPFGRLNRVLKTVCQFISYWRNPIIYYNISLFLVKYSGSFFDIPKLIPQNCYNENPCPSLELYYEKPLVYEESVSAAKAFLLAYSDNDYPLLIFLPPLTLYQSYAIQKVHRPYVSGESSRPQYNWTGSSNQINSISTCTSLIL